MISLKDEKQFNTPAKQRTSIETRQLLQWYQSPEKSKSHSDIVAQILGQSIYNSIPFFSSAQHNFTYSQCQSSYSQYQSYEQSPTQSHEPNYTQEANYHTVRKFPPSQLQSLLLTQRKSQKSTHLSKRGCNCDKSKCMKNYCVCYKNGMTCGQDCQCIQCANTQITSMHHKNEQKALEIDNNLILKGCNCKNSNCVKGYCVCHSKGRKCNEICKCQSCFNLSKNQGKGEQEVNYDLIGMSSKKRVKIAQFSYQMSENKEKN